MYKIYTILSFFCYQLLFTQAYAQSQLHDFFEGAELSNWKGLERFDFSFQGREARLVIPNKAIPGKPWIWRARFPDWHTTADSILVAEGFHLAYIKLGMIFILY